MASFTSVWEFKDILFSLPILRISICCFYSNSQDLTVSSSKVLIDTGFHVGRGGANQELCVCMSVCVLECGGWLVIICFRMLLALGLVTQTHTHTDRHCNSIY